MARSVLVACGCVLAFGVWAGCGASASAPAAQRSSRTVQVSTRPATGRRVFRFVDRSRSARFRNGTRGPRNLVTYVRYPTTGRAPFPLVIFCHGFSLLPSTYSRLLHAWTRAGYVVAAPVFPVENADAPGGPDEADLFNQPGDVSFVIGELFRTSLSRHSPLHGLIDPSRIAVAGHSDGGETAFAVAYERHYLDHRVHAAVVLSGAELAPDAISSSRHRPPLLAVQGSADKINPPVYSRALFEDASAPKYLLTLIHAGHLPPYTSNRRRLALVERVSIAFLNHYFKDGPLRPLLAAGNSERGAARLTSDP